jgi:hypothetical protein
LNQKLEHEVLLNHVDDQINEYKTSVEGKIKDLTEELDKLLQLLPADAA